MARTTGLVVLVLFIPVLGYGCANASQGQLDSQLRDALREEYSSVTEEQLSSVTLSKLCNQPDFQGEDICSTADNITLIKQASVGSGLVGLALLVLIWIAGRVARDRRRLLLLLFRPGLHLTALILVGLVICYAAIAMGAIYYTESLFLGQVHVVLIGVIGLGALAGTGAIATNALRFVQKAETTAIGVSVSEEEAPKLWSEVKSLSEEMGALVPDQIVLGVEPNFYVTEAKVSCLSGTISGRTLYCSSSLMRILTKDEAKAILAHELAHFKGEDTVYSRKFYPVYRGAQDSLEALVRTGGEGYKALALLPAMAIFRHFLDSFSVAEREISRRRELAADAESATRFDGKTLCVALVKIHAFSAGWQPIQEQAVTLLQKGQMFENIGAYFSQIVNDSATPGILEDVADQRMSHPTDTHPPLSARLEAQGIPVSEVTDEALNVSPADPAIGLVASPEEVEENVSDAYQIVLARRLGIEVEDGESI